MGGGGLSVSRVPLSMVLGTLPPYTDLYTLSHAKSYPQLGAFTANSYPQSMHSLSTVNAQDIHTA